MPESTRSNKVTINFDDSKQPVFKVGLIGCGQVGTMILTKLLEIQGQIPHLKLMVSTRQPHLLRAFQQEFGIWVDYNNERIVAECDLIFLCVLPFQAQQVLKDVRALATQRSFVFTDHLLSKTKTSKAPHTGMGDRVPPLFVSCLSATSTPKLK